MPKDKEKGDAASLRDVDMYMQQIEAVNKQYANVVAKLAAIKDDKKKGLDKTDLLMERDTLKNTFIAKKKACRGNIKLLPENLGILKERELKALQDAYREIDADFKQLGVLVERNQLLEGAAERRNDFDPARATNDDLLDKAKGMQQDTTAKLKEGLAVLEATKDQAKYTAAVLEQDREKMQRISKGLDEVDSELEISKKLLTRFVKRIYTDKIIIAFTALILMGVVGIIIYASMNPDQSIFTVPDLAKLPDGNTLASQVAALAASNIPGAGSFLGISPGARMLRGAAVDAAAAAAGAAAAGLGPA